MGIGAHGVLGFTLPPRGKIANPPLPRSEIWGVLFLGLLVDFWAIFSRFLVKNSFFVENREIFAETAVLK